MFLKKLHLINYKNFDDKSFEFTSQINAFVGNNGIGKTNILDAIYHLASGKSYFNVVSIQNIKHDEDFFMIEGTFNAQEREEQIVCSLKKGQKKVLKRNGKIYEKFSEHIGLIPIVMISPADNDLIKEGSEERRKFIDIVVSQYDKSYLSLLIKYQKVVAQRNALLKYFSLNQVFDRDNLAVYNDQILLLAQPIYEKRKAFIELFTPIFIDYHSKITGNNENVSLIYQSHLSDGNFENLLEQSLAKDRVLQYTSVGVHKDDLLFMIGNNPIKKFGSQGQQKSFLISLKLAQFGLLSKQNNQKPIVLFDDVFDKLDEKRVNQIVSLIADDAFGQLFITDTHSERTEKILNKTEKNNSVFSL